MPTSIMQKNYSNCPLKKRPVIHVVGDELLKEELSNSDNDLEPENLSTKPEDLSKNSKSGNIQATVVIDDESRTKSPIEVIETLPIKVSIQERRNHTISPIKIPPPAITPPLNQSYPPTINYYPPTLKVEPLNLNQNCVSIDHINYASPTNWHKPIVPTPTYHNYSPHSSYNIQHPYDAYSSLYHQISPTRSDQLSPYHSQRESSISPPSQYYHNSHYILNSNHRDNSLSPPIQIQYPTSVRRKAEHSYQTTQHRYIPYHLNHHHHHHNQLIMPIDQSSLSPTSSHTSYNSLLSSHSIRSLSPLSTSPSSTPEDLSNGSINVVHTNEKSISIKPQIRSVNNNSIKKENIEKVNNNPNSAPRYQCPDCGKSYSTYSGLSKHQQFHCPAAIGNQVKKSFSCKYCEKVYVSLGALKMHIRTHTLPCKCTTCGKAFSRPWLLQGHIRTHTGEKPFSCQHCHRAFADRSNLRAHLQTHSDIKKYSCTNCSKTFSRMSLLTKHNEGGCLMNNNNNNNIPNQIHKEISVY